MPSLNKQQFSLRTLLVSLIVIAMLITIGMRIRYHYFLLPNHPKILLNADSSVDDVIRYLNDEVALYAMSGDFALVKWELIDAVVGQQSIPSESFTDDAVRIRVQSKVDAVCDEIVSTGILPANSELEMSKDGIVTLNIPFDSTTGHGFLIRHPGLGRTSTAEYKMDFSWKPRSGYDYAWSRGEWKAIAKQ